jgi:uncharacterized protein YoxC
MVLTISVTIIAVVMVVAMLFLILTLLQIRRTAREVEKILETTRMQIVPLSHDLTVISQEVKGVLESIHRQVDGVEESITTVRDAFVRLREFEEEILPEIEKPLLELATLVSAVSRAIKTFVRMLSR